MEVADNVTPASLFQPPTAATNMADTMDIDMDIDLTEDPETARMMEEEMARNVGAGALFARSCTC